MDKTEQTTLRLIHSVALREFLEKGFRCASLRNIVKTAGVTTGAFYGYYKSKEDLFDALVGEQYEYMIQCISNAQKEFTSLSVLELSDHMAITSGKFLFDLLEYAYEHLDEFKLMLCYSEGTRFAAIIDELVEIELKGTNHYLSVLTQLGTPAPPIDEHFKHILITGMFNTFFELIIHEIPLEEARQYCDQMRVFYIAGWRKIMGL